MDIRRSRRFLFAFPGPLVAIALAGCPQAATKMSASGFGGPPGASNATGTGGSGAGTTVGGSSPGTPGTAGTIGQSGSGSVKGAAGSGGGAGMAAGTGGAGMASDAGSGVDDTTGPANPTTVDMVGNANRAPGFIDLSPPMGAPLPDQGSSVTPTPPAGWSWYPIDGTFCRDGSPSGLYLHTGTAKALLIFLEGGGACSNDHYCAFNPANVDQILAGDGQTVLNSALGAGDGRQQPGGYTDATHMGAPAGIFDTSKADNPFKDWNQIYIPYCTGDVHFGTKKAGMVPNLDTPQQFVGYANMKTYVGRIVPTFKSKVDQVVIAGSSAGGFGAALNFSMVQDAFGDVPVTVLDDSGPPFDDKYMPVCMQKRWREAWGLDDAMPPDCTECRQADGGGMLHLSDFLLRKHPKAKIGVISSMEDEVIRLFYSVGLGDCANYDSADPVAVVLLQSDPATFFPAQQYTDGLNTLRSTYKSTNRFASFYIGGDNITYHQHLFRDRFYDTSVGTETIAKFSANLIAGTVDTIGP